MRATGRRMNEFIFYNSIYFLLTAFLARYKRVIYPSHFIIRSVHTE